MIGQSKILAKLNNLTLDTLPHSLMLVGDFGCGKHMLCNAISEKFKMEVTDISDKLTFDLISEIEGLANPHMYIINGDKITLKEEATILKFLEEPTKFAFIIILCENKNRMLDTILNRCIIWEFAPYTLAELSTFQWQGSNLLFSIANTPGKVIKWCELPLDEMYELSMKILDKMDKANFANALSLANKIDLSNKGKGYDKDAFFAILNYTAYCKVLDCKEEKWYNVYKLTNQLLNDSHILHIDNTKLFEHYVYELKKILV